MKLKSDKAGRFGFFPFTWFSFGQSSKKCRRAAGKLESKLKRKEDAIERTGVGQKI
jgi:hypothetical protein